MKTLEIRVTMNEDGTGYFTIVAQHESATSAPGYIHGFNNLDEIYHLLYNFFQIIFVACWATPSIYFRGTEYVNATDLSAAILRWYHSTIANEKFSDRL